MNEKRLSIGGIVTTWDAQASSREKLKNGLEPLGMEECITEQPTPQTALKSALSKVIKPQTKGNKILVRPLEKEGFEVVEETRGERENTYEHILTATIDSEDMWGIKLDPSPDSDTLDAVRDTYVATRATVSAASVGTILTSIISKWSGVPLRDQGGAYWLNIDSKDQWKEVAAVIEGAYLKSGDDDKDKPTRVKILTVIADEQMVRDVGDSLTADVTKLLDAIQSDIDSGDLREQACFTRQKRANAAVEKVKTYEQAFGMQLETLKARAAAIETAACIAGLQLAASASPLCENNQDAANSAA